MSPGPEQQRTSSGRGFRLITLGRVELHGPAGEDTSLTTRRRKLALLALLAVSGRAWARDDLVQLFWGDEQGARARHRLSDALSHLRRALGPDAISGRRSAVELNRRLALSVDALELLAAGDRGDWARVAALYQGPFLSGVSVVGSPRFEAWVEPERARCRRLFLRACAARCATLAARGDWAGSAELAGRWQEADPGATEPGDWLARSRARLAAAPAAERGDPAEPPVGVRRPRRRLVTTAAILALVVGVGILVPGRHAAGARPDGRPLLALVGLSGLPSDTAAAGLPRLIVAGLAGSHGLRVVSPARVREVARLARLRDPRSGTVLDALVLGHRLGATWVVTGSITHQAGRYLLTLMLWDPASGKAHRVPAVSGPDAPAVAEAATAALGALAESLAPAGLTRGSGPAGADRGGDGTSR